MQKPCSQSPIGIRKKHLSCITGFSLVETLVGISLLGVVLVPMLFMSSSYFLRQLSTTRQSMEVSHSTSQFLNRFMEELYQASRILNSDATHLYFAYYDASTQREVKTGYQLTTVGSNRILEKLVYNPVTNNWDAISPYSETDAKKLLLPSSAIFTYCQDSATPCAAATTSQSALLVRLYGWTFSNASNSQNLALPNVDVYIAAGASATDSAILSDVPQEMYNIDTTNAFGSTADLTLFNISPYTGQLNDAVMSLGGGGGGGGGGGSGSGVLSTIHNGADDAYYGMRVASDGRLYTAEAWQGSTGCFITYHPSTGVSTLVSGVAGPGNFYATAVSPADGRVYFASQGNSAKAWTWHPSTGLTTIITSDISPGKAAMAVANDGRVYFGNAAGKFWTYHPSTNLTTIKLPAIGANTNYTNAGSYLNVVTSPIDNRVYFSAEENNGTTWDFFTWSPSDGIITATALPFSTTPLTTAYQWSDDLLGPSLKVNPVTGGVYMVDNLATNSHVYYWAPGMGTTSTIVNNANGGIYLGYRGAMDVAADGRVFFSESFWNTNGQNVWSWKPGDTPPTSPLYTSTKSNPGNSAFKVTPTGTLFFTDGSQINSDNLHTGSFTTPITTVTAFTSGQNTGAGNMPASEDEHYTGKAFLARPDGRIFFSDSRSTKSSMWTWASSTGLSTIWSSPVSGGYPGHTAMVFDDNGRLYFSGDTRQLAGSTTNAQPMFTWHESTGLSTIIGAGDDRFGALGQMTSIPGTVGGVYFQGTGDISAHGYPVWRWVPGVPTIGMKRASDTGAPTLKSINLSKSGGDTYVASTQDSDGNLFYVNSTSKTVDRYTSTTDTSGTVNYTLAAQFNWGTWASSVNSVAVDENSTQIALLDSGNKAVDIYANRSVSGTPAAPGTFSVSAQSTLPTSLVISNRTGNYLVLDSTVRNADSTHPYKYINLNVYAASNYAYLRSIPITVEGGITNGRLSVDATGETNFKMALNNRRNVLYLAVPTLNKIFVLSLPEYL